MLCGAVSHRGLCPLIVLHGRVSAPLYVSILADHLHPMTQNVISGS